MNGTDPPEPPRPRSQRRVGRRTAVVAAVLLGATGCLGTFPKDTQGTLEQATGGTLRVGVSENPPHTEVSSDGAVSGSEIELITDYAAGIGAELDWVPGAESVLAEAMGAGELDLVIGGLTSDVPWTGDIALTRPYGETQVPGGTVKELVIGVQPGENALMVDLELFLAEAAGDL